MPRSLFVLLVIATPVGVAAAQGTAADYARAASVADRIERAVVQVADPPTWLSGDRFWYRKSVRGGNVFVLVDAATGRKTPAFDHERVAAALSAATGRRYTATTLPFRAVAFADSDRALDVVVDSARFHCTLSDGACAKLNVQQSGSRGRGGGRGGVQLFGGGLYGNERPSIDAPTVSPDGRMEAFVQDYNVFIRPAGSSSATQLSADGKRGDAYDPASVSWSPDSRMIAAYRVIPGQRRVVHYVQSSPSDQVQPKTVERLYNKPGDTLDLDQPVLFDVATKKATPIANTLFPNAYTQTALVWRRDGRAVTFEYNQRGHQAFRVIEIDAATGATRSIINEETPTFFEYSAKKYRFDVGDGREIIWMSERDGWNHLYLYDGATGRVKNQITKGSWLVRGVDRVDTTARQIWFRASGMNPGEDPYFIHYYRVNFDGTGLTAYTTGPGTHSVSFSPDFRYYVDTWSRIDRPPVSELHRASDRSIIAALETADAAGLRATGLRAPEPFVAKGRDGATDIYGIIVRPSTFNPAKKYPVIEYIYAGPHDSFVPKAWGIPVGMQAQAELGFIVVQIDGMGTSNRSKAFHDVAWQNIADAGFPDRILWHKAVAKKYPWYDISRVGIYGGSAGGQNSTGALLFHPEFYKVAVSFAGCHDNRMDKIWWNEQWMGWPIGPQYAKSSNVDNASRLQGKLLLLVGELDENVDPSSTFQVANALIKANKSFDLFVFPNGDHGVGRRGPLSAYGDRKQWDYFVHNLLGVEPPNRNLFAATSDAARRIGSAYSPHGSITGESWDAIFEKWGR